MSRLNKTWTADEIDYLISAWGNVNMATITKHLDRSECAIRLKAGKLNLGPFLANGYRYITISNLYKLIRPNTSATYLKTSWVKIGICLLTTFQEVQKQISSLFT